MKLVASLVVRDELGRYLEQSIPHLLEFCDEVRVLDDGSTDGSGEWLDAYASSRLVVERATESRFFAHEGRLRQRLLEWTLAGDPTHILSIDADEFVADGKAVRAAIEWQNPNGVWTLDIEEVWKSVDDGCLCVREDGGWRTHGVPVLYAVPSSLPAEWRIRDLALASGREPLYIRRQWQRGLAPSAGTELLHFGWANEAERAARYERYAVADGGRFHARHHLDSIMWPDDRVEMRGRPWPAGLKRYRRQLQARVRRG